MLNFISKVIKSHPIGQAFGLQGQQVAWKKVKDLKTGTMIAVENNGHLDWDEIVSIKKVSRKRVYDIEVEKTHNFVANGIVAHNTYISGNVGIGVTSPTARLSIGGTSSVISNLVGDITITPASNLIISQGNVGIGTTNPTYKLEVAGNASIGGDLDMNNFYITNGTQPGGSNFLGNQAGLGATSASFSNFFGQYAGRNAASASYSNILGYFAGYNATNANHSNFLGEVAGYSATNANDSNFLGHYAGYNATNANNSNFLGYMVGYNATNASNSNFFGYNAGIGATNASNSIFIGSYAGNRDTVNNSTAGYSSIAIGRYAGTGGFSNSIALGRGVINSGTTQANIGNVLYLSGIYNSDTQSATPTAGGRVGIGTATPSQALDVNGSVNIGGSLAIGSIGSTADNNRVLTSSAAGSGIVRYIDTSAWDKDAASDISVATNGLQLIGTTAVGLGGTLTQNTKLSVGNTAAFFINSTSGFVGIGTSDPTSILTVNGDITGNKFIDYQNGLYFLDPASADSLSSSLALSTIGSIKWNAKYSGSSWSNISSGYAASKIENGVRGLLLSIGNTGVGGTITSWNTNLFLAGNGRVGVGTSSPGYTLQVIGDVGVSSALTVGTSLSVGTTTYTGSLNINKATAVGGSYVAAFVGTGTTGFLGYLDTSAWDKLASDDHTVAANGLQEIGTSTVGLGGTLTQTSFTNINIGTGSSGLAILGLNNNTQALTIRQNGNVGIGTINPTYKLHVIGNSYISTSLSVGTSLNVGGPASIGGNLNMNNFFITNGTQPGGSNFIGYQAGLGATSASNSNFIGEQAGYQATKAIDSNFIGRQAGYQATNATYSIFLGTAAGQSATDAQRSVFLGQSAGYQATSASYSNFLGYLAGNSATNANHSNFLGYYAGNSASQAYFSNFLGNEAGYSATNANHSNFLGNQAGYSATSASNSNFLGNQAGYSATSASYSNFIGFQSGVGASNAFDSNFLGMRAGQHATNANESNFLGYYAGEYATNAYASNFIGDHAGTGSTNAANSIFIGYYAGSNDSVNNYGNNYSNIAIGRYAGTGGFSNSIAIGRGVINSGTTQANIGNVLYLNGIYNSDTRSSTPTANGRVGIGINNPTYKIQVNGQPAANGYTAWTNYSDQRLKTNIQKLSGNYLDKIMLLDPVTFNYNDTYYSQTNYSRPVGEIPTYTGFIAQDLQKIFPEMVGMSENGYLDTNLGNLQLYLIKGIQEQQAQISTISARLDNVFISDIGQVAINYNVSDEVLSSLGYSGTKNEIEAATYSLTDTLGNAVTRVGQYGKLAAAKIETAYLSAKSIVVDNLAARRIASETIITGEITGTEALFDSATVGSLTAESIGASEASFSTVYADQIINPEGNISEVFASKITDLRDEIKSMIASSSAEATPSAIAIESETWDTPLATESADLALDNLTLSDSLVIASQLTVGGHSSLSSVNVTGTLTVGQIAFNDNIIETTAEALYIQPSGLGSVHILNDRLVLSSDGSVTINGNLNVTGSLIAQMLKAEEIETKKLTTEKINIILPAQTAELLAGPVIASDSAAISPIIASALPAEVSTQAGTLASNATVGTVTLAAGQTEITIQNPSLTANSMVYLTPNGSTGNQVVYIKSKSVADPLISPTPSAFTIAIDEPLTQNVDINWWLIN